MAFFFNGFSRTGPLQKMHVTYAVFGIVQRQDRFYLPLQRMIGPLFRAPDIKE
jgi:hypothetical protein